MSISNTTFHPSRVEDRIYDLMNEEEYIVGIDLYTEDLFTAVHKMITEEFPNVEYETYAIRSIRDTNIYFQSFAWVEDGHIHLIGWDFVKEAV
jgi:hypothetical protein